MSFERSTRPDTIQRCLDLILEQSYSDCAKCREIPAPVDAGALR